jgi:YidC/Oxa1 family membrane protein insertase
MGVSMFVQTKMNPAPADPIQEKVFLFMPLFFTFLLARFPAGLVIYWAWNNVLSITQQYVIMKRQGVDVELFDRLGLQKLLDKLSKAPETGEAQETKDEENKP